MSGVTALLGWAFGSWAEPIPIRIHDISCKPNAGLENLSPQVDKFDAAEEVVTTGHLVSRAER